MNNPPPDSASQDNMESSQLQISVIIPAYNAEDVLPRCLQALAEQTLAADTYEVIVVDDGSTDATAGIARSAGAHVLTVAHAGPASARNHGVNIARAPVVVFTDADCEPAPDFLEELVRPLQSQEISGSRGVYRCRQREWVARFVQVEFEERYHRIANYQADHGTVDALDTSYCAYRRDAFVAAGGFDARFAAAAGEDHELSFRMVRDGHIFRFVATAAVYHWHVTSIVTYARRKFRIGFWKAFLARQHPSYILGDAHTTQSLKIQIALAAMLWPGLLLWAFWSLAGWWVLGVMLLFVISALPLVALLWQRDRALLIVALPFLLVRATASGLGFAWGLVRANSGLKVKGLDSPSR